VLMLKAHTPHKIANIGSFQHAMLTWLNVPAWYLGSSVFPQVSALEAALDPMEQT
jgi:hypothetical protein